MIDSHAVHKAANDKSADDVDDGNYDTGNHVPFDEFHRTVHGAVELAFFLEGKAHLPRLVRVDDTRAHVGVDAHLLARHRIQGKARRNLGYPLGTFCDDDELHDGDDEEDNAADDEVAADHHLAECEDHISRVGVE